MLKKKSFSSINSIDLIKIILIKYNNRFNKNKLVNNSHSHLTQIIRLLMYLVEWKYILEYEKSLSNITWTYNGCMTYSKYLNEYNLVFFNLTAPEIDLSDNIQKCIDFAFDKYEKLEFKYTELAHLCSSTYPCIVSKNKTKVNLLNLSKQYKSEYNYCKTINI